MALLSARAQRKIQRWLVGHLLICLCSIFVVDHGILADPLFPNPLLATGSAPSSAVIRDFNQDGRKDLAVANWDSGDVSVILGNGDGTFAPQTRFESGGGAALAAGDFDGDGNADLAVAGEGVAVLLGRGDGTFDPAVRYEAGFTPLSVAVGDFNSDGREDLVVANCDSLDVSVFLGNGDGTFASQSRFPAGYCPLSVAVADLDSNAEPDLVVVNYSHRISILLGGGDGTFSLARQIAAFTFPSSIAVGDFNGDGAKDLAVALSGECDASFPNGVSVLLGNGDGSFGAETRLEAGRLPLSVAIGDFNHDGNEDLAAGSGDCSFLPGEVSIFLGNGDGTFAPPARSEVGIVPTSVGVEDFDGDGSQDLVVTDEASNYALPLLGRGDGTFFPPGSPAAHFRAGEFPNHVAVGDLDGDGRQDLAVANELSDDVSIFLGDGTGRFGPPANYAAGGFPYAIAGGDFDGDGNRDLAVANHLSIIANRFQGDISVLLGVGDGTFAPQVRLLAGYFPISIASGDFNGDGKDDVAVANSGDFDSSRGDVSVFLSHGKGEFDPPLTLPVGEFPTSVTVGDHDGDGRVDLAVANNGSDHVSVFLGNGDGSFAPEAQVPAGPFPRSVVAGDFNGDGRDDLAVGSGRRVSVLMSRGAGTFDLPAGYVAGGAPLYLAVGDFNGDETKDLVAVDYLSDDIAILLGKGDGTFDPHVSFRVGLFPTAAAVGDFDADARQDLAVVTQYDEGVTVLLNQGPFPKRPPVARAVAGRRIECTSSAGATVVLDGSGSTDPDSLPGTRDDIVSYEWLENLGGAAERFVGSGETLGVTLPLGPHRVALRVTDRVGKSDIDEVLVEVVDTTAPEISLTLAAPQLWPPNHRMVEVGAEVNARDACGAVSVVLESVTSSEPDDAKGLGDGRTTQDIQGTSLGTADFQFQVRAERSAKGKGRTYTVTYCAIDSSANVERATSRVSIPASLDRFTPPGRPSP